MGDIVKDPFGRNINYLRISVTDLCNLRCRYCMPEEGIPKLSRKDILTVEEIAEIAKVFVKLGINKVRLTGGEPLVRRGILDIVEKIGKLDGLKDLAMTTNGVLLKKYAKELKLRGLKRVNISLDTLNEDKYKYITRRGSIKDVMEGIEAAKKYGLTPIKINTVLVKGFNDDEIEALAGLTEKEEIDVRFIELMPIGVTAKDELNGFISNDIVLKKLPELIKVEREDPSSPALYYKLPNARGKIGLINPISCKFCKYCNRVRLTAQGSLKLCLHSNEEINLKVALKSGQDIESIIINAIDKKPQSHNLEDKKYVTKNMYQIGG